jgi:mannose-6-phosphate isomerase
MIDFVSKPWGYEKIIHNDKLYCGKQLFVAKDQYTSWHYHKTKHKTLFVESGYLVVRVAENIPDREIALRELYDLQDILRVGILPGEAYEIKPGTRHRLTAISDCVIFEFSTEHREEDTVRILSGA